MSEKAITKIESLIKGQNSKELAQEVLSDAKLAVEIQSSVQKGEMAKAEKEVKKATEAVEKAIFNNGKNEVEEDYYIKDIITANTELEEAKEKLENLQKISTWLNEANEKLNS